MSPAADFQDLNDVSPIRDDVCDERNQQRRDGMTAYSIVSVERQPTAVVKAHVAFADLPSTERSARAKLASVLPQLKIGPIGDSFTLSRMPSGGKIYIEPGVIVARSFEPDGDVVPSHLPAGRAVRHLLIGPLDLRPNGCKSRRAGDDLVRVARTSRGANLAPHSGS
jgi:hypothetical protein